MFWNVLLVSVLTLLVVYDMYRLHTANSESAQIRERLDDLFPEPLDKS